MAFTDGGVRTTSDTMSRRLLLVADCGKRDRNTVHVIDVVRGTHVGYVTAPGTIVWPRGVATRQSQAAVSCWEVTAPNYGPVVRVYEGHDECTWTPVRVIVGGLNGLRLTADGLKLIAADFGNDRVSVFCAEDGSFLRHIAFPRNEPGLGSLDVEECAIDGDRAGVVVCHSGGLVAVVDAVVRRIDLDFNCHALSRIPWSWFGGAA
jgi:hypothetical protein